MNTIKKFLFGTVLTTFAFAASAATVSWTVSDIQENGSNVNGCMFFLVNENITSNSLAKLAGKGATAFTTALGASSAHAFEWKVENGVGTLQNKHPDQPTLSDLGINESTMYTFYVLAFDTATITDESKYYITNLMSYKTGAGDANTAVYFGSKKSSSGAPGAWLAVREYPIPVTYLDAAGVAQTTNALVVKASDEAVTWEAGWYVVTNEVTVKGGADCSGAVNLILADGAKLTIKDVADSVAGIAVTNDNSLAIYGQSAGTGALVVTGGMYAAGIGGGEAGTGSNITINGGTVTAAGGEKAAGIGGGYGGSGHDITINGGFTRAAGKNGGAAIGGGEQYNGGGEGYAIIINGGTIDATDAWHTHNIGSGNDGPKNPDDVKFAGGSIWAKREDTWGPYQPINTEGKRVYEVTVTNVQAAGRVSITELEAYGVNDIFAIDNKLKFYLPNGTYCFVAGDVRYEATVNNNAVTAQITSLLKEVTKPEYATVTAVTTNGVAATVPCTVPYETAISITYTADPGYVFPGGYKTFTTNLTANVATMTVALTKDQLPGLAVTVDLVQPENVTILTNGFQVTGAFQTRSNDVLNVTYKTDSGCYFADGTTEKVKQIKAALNPTTGPADGKDYNAYAAHHCNGKTFTKRITDTATLQALFSDGGYGYLATNVTLTTTVINDSGDGVFLCLNGQTLDTTSCNLFIRNTLELYDCGTTTNYFKIREDGLWTRTYDVAQADTNLVGGVVTGGNAAYPPLAVNTFAALTIYGGNYVGVKAGNYGGVICADGSLDVSIEGGTFAGNVANKGGVIYATQAQSVTIDGGTFIGNVAKNGGVIYIDSEMSVTINGGMFANNTAQYGGVYFSNYNSCELTVNGGTFVGNKVEGENGPSGTVFYNDGTMLLQGDAVITNNVGVWGTIYNYGTLTVKGNVQIVGNTVTGNGGAIYNRRNNSTYPGKCSVNGGTFTGNGDYTAFVNQGGVFTLGGSPVIGLNGREGEEYDLVASKDSSFTLSTTVPYTADQVLTIGSFVADGTNSNITVLTNAKATDVNRFASCNPVYEIMFDASDDTLKLVIPVKLSGVMTGVATNASSVVVSVNGQTIAEESGTYKVPKGCKISVTYTAKDDFMFAGGAKTKTVTVGPLTGDYEMTDADKPVAEVCWAEEREIAIDTRERVVVAAPEEVLPIAYSTNNWGKVLGSGDNPFYVTILSVNGAQLTVATKNGYQEWKPELGVYGRYNVAQAWLVDGTPMGTTNVTVYYSIPFPLTLPTVEGGSFVAITNGIEATGTIQTLGFENVTIAAKPEDARWAVKEMVALTNNVELLLEKDKTSVTNRFEMPCYDTVVTGAFVIAESYRAELAEAVTNSYLATSNNLEQLRHHRLSDAETDEALAAARYYFAVHAKNVCLATKPNSAEAFTNQLAKSLENIENLAKKVSDEKPTDILIADDYAAIPGAIYDPATGEIIIGESVYTNGISAFTSFTECFTNETYGMFATNLYIFGNQTISMEPTLVDPWTLNLCTISTGGTEVVSAQVSVGVTDETPSKLINITNNLASIDGVGAIILGKTDVPATIYDDLKADRAVVGVTTTGVEPVVGGDNIQYIIGTDVKVEEIEWGKKGVLLPGVENLKGTISITVQTESTNDVEVAGSLVAPNHDVTLQNDSTNVLSVSGKIEAKNLYVNNSGRTADAEGSILAPKANASGDVEIWNKAHLEANIVASGKISIANGNINTLVGSYQGHAIEITAAEDGAISNVTFISDTPVTMGGHNVLTGPFTIKAPSVNNSGTVTFSVANDNHTTWLSDLNSVNGNGIETAGEIGKFKIKVDAAQAGGNVAGAYVIASNAECACDQIAGTGKFTLTGDPQVEGKSIDIASAWFDGDIAEKTLYIGAKAYSLYRRAVDVDGDASVDYCELVFEVRFGKFAITYDAMGPYFEAVETTVVSDSFVHVGYELPADPVRQGYTFLGWFDGVTNDAPQAVAHTPLCYTNEHTVFARWQDNGGVPSAALLLASEGTLTPAGNVGDNLVLPDTMDGKPVLKIGKASFAAANYTASSITNFVTGLFLREILPGAFNQVTTLKTLKISESRDFDDPTNRVAVTIGKRAFAGTRIESLEIAEGTIIGEQAFRGCSYLKEIAFFGDAANASLTADAFTLCGYANGTGKIKLYMTDAFKTANAAFVTALKNGYASSNIEIADLAGYSPATSVSISGLDVSQPTEMSLTVSADALIKGTSAFVSSITILYREQLTDAEREYAPTSVVPNGDGTYTIKFTAPNDGRGGFMRVVVK